MKALNNVIIAPLPILNIWIIEQHNIGLKEMMNKNRLCL